MESSQITNEQHEDHATSLIWLQDRLNDRQVRLLGKVKCEVIKVTDFDQFS